MIRVLYFSSFLVLFFSCTRLQDNSSQVSKDDFAFDDEAFRNYCISNYDKDHNNVISLVEIADVDTIVCENAGINSLSALRFFPKLRYLDVSGNNLVCLDFSFNPLIEYLDCRNNKLKSIDLMKAQNIKTLLCKNNQIDSICLFKLPSVFESDKKVSLVYKKCGKAMFTLIDDDFILPQASSLKLLCDELDIKCDFALIPFINIYDELYFTDDKWSVVCDYLDNGFGFLLHPRHNYWYNDNANCNFVDLAHVEQSLSSTINLFKSCSLNTGCLVYPGNADMPGEREMCRMYISYGVSTNGYYNTDLSQPFDLKRLMARFDIFGKQKIKDIIDEGVSNNAWIIIGTHAWQYSSESQSDDSTNSWDNLKEILEYAKSKAPFYTFEEALLIMSEN